MTFDVLRFPAQILDPAILCGLLESDDPGRSIQFHSTRPIFVSCAGPGGRERERERERC